MGDGADGFDGSANWLNVDSYIPPNPVQPDGTAFVPAASLGFRLSIANNGANLDFEWESQTGMLYNLKSSTDLAADLSTWGPGGRRHPGDAIDQLEDHPTAGGPGTLLSGGGVSRTTSGDFLGRL